MTKHLIIKYLEQRASEAEERAVLEWVSMSEENLKYFSTIKNLWIFQNMPNSKAGVSELAEVKKNIQISSFRKKRSKKVIFLQYAAASVIIILLGLNLFRLSEKPGALDVPKQERELLTNLPNEQKHVLYTNNGIKGFVELPDGSKVWLNSASRIEYPDKFRGATREVIISGEAFFDVVSNPQKPMIVSTNKDFRVEVLGTKFNIRSYDDDIDAQTTLFSGSIKLTRKLPSSKIELITKLKPKESFVIRGKMPPVLIKQADTSRQVAWKEGKIIFDSTPMQEVIKKLERWHGTEFILKDKEILNYKITANFRSESIVQIMEMIEFCSSISYKIEGNRVTLRIKKSTRNQ